jgi:hypothetical protein
MNDFNPDGLTVVLQRQPRIQRRMVRIPQAQGDKRLLNMFGSALMVDVAARRWRKRRKNPFTSGVNRFTQRMKEITRRQGVHCSRWRGAASAKGMSPAWTARRTVVASEHD